MVASLKTYYAKGAQIHEDKFQLDYAPYNLLESLLRARIMGFVLSLRVKILASKERHFCTYLALDAYQGKTDLVPGHFP